MNVDVVIIGAGVVGLACAAESASAGFETLLIERHLSFGQETSSRNSEVIHSGIYYTPGSMKARLCVAANAGLYADCERAGVWARRCGKLVVAVTADEEDELNKIYGRGTQNGVPRLNMLTASAARQLEPEIVCHAALFVPSAGILDSHELMKAYLHEAQSRGAMIAMGVEFLGVAGAGNGFTLELKDTDNRVSEVHTRVVVNSAGLSADSVAEKFGIDPDSAGYRIHPNRGHYFRVAASKSARVSRLIYPVPYPNLEGLGVHITPDRAGQCRIGPDQEYVDHHRSQSEWYKFDESRKERFFRGVARYFPALEMNDLSPDQIGVRAKLSAPGAPARDFIIAEESSRGLPGLVNLIGIESPGLTCSREIAREVRKFLYH